MEQITAFFDMEDSGMSNMDLDYTRYIINLFKHYYPNSLNYILVYELPWVLTGMCLILIDELNCIYFYFSFSHF